MTVHAGNIYVTNRKVSYFQQTENFNRALRLRKVLGRKIYTSFFDWVEKVARATARTAPNYPSSLVEPALSLALVSYLVFFWLFVFSLFVGVGCSYHLSSLTEGFGFLVE